MRRNAQSIYHSLEELVNDLFGENVSILKMESVPGGDINNAYRLSLPNGESLFVKTNSASNLDSFLTESGGLCALRSLKNRIRRTVCPSFPEENRSTGSPGRRNR